MRQRCVGQRMIFWRNVMFHEEIDNQYIVYQEGTSEGTQLKYYKDGYWYKEE